jgi:hypothetical protein
MSLTLSLTFCERFDCHRVSASAALYSLHNREKMSYECNFSGIEIFDYLVSLCWKLTDYPYYRLNNYYYLFKLPKEVRKPHAIN